MYSINPFIIYSLCMKYDETDFSQNKAERDINV